MIEKELIIPNSLGLHARPAALLAQEAGRFKSAVLISKNGVEVNAKSVMGLMLLAAECGAKVNVRADGPDEVAVIEALKLLFQKKFGEQ
jgi:phosphocarrier protein